MKKRKMLLSAIMATAVLSFSGCAATESLQNVSTDAEGEEAVEEEPAAEENGTEAKEGSDDEALKRSGSEGIQPDDEVIPGDAQYYNADGTVEVITHSLTMPGEAGGEIVDFVTANYCEIEFEPEYASAHPELVKAVSDAMLKESDVKAEMAEYYEYAQEMVADSGDDFWGLPYCAEYGIEVLRWDDSMFVYRVSTYGWAGGAHGFGASTYYSFDVATGKQLDISDFIADSGELGDRIMDKLKKEYPDNEEIVNGEEYFSPLETIKSEIEDKTLDCAVYGDGLHVDFDQYEIASYAAGAFEVTLTAEDYGETMRDFCMPDGTGPLSQIVFYDNLEVEVIE